MTEFETTPSYGMDPSLERTFRGHRNYITSTSFSPTMKQLASSSGDNTIMLWNFKPQLRAFRFIGHKGVVTNVQFSPQGDILASASKDKTVRLWTPTAKGESTTLKGHTGAVRSVAFSNDSRNLITASDDKTAKIWALPTRKFLCSLTGHSNWVRSASLSPDSQNAVTGGDDKLVKLWDVNTHQPLHTFYEHSDTVNQVCFVNDGSCIASGSSDKSLKMWDLRSHNLIQHYPAHADSVTNISMHPSGYYMLSSSKDSTLKIWDLREGRLLFTLQGHSGPVNAASFSHDGHFFASGGADQLVMVWKSNLFGEKAPILEWGQGQPPRSATQSSRINSRTTIKLPTNDKQKDSQHVKSSLYNYSIPKTPLSNSTESNSIKKLTSAIPRPKTAPVTSSSHEVTKSKSTKLEIKNPKNDSITIPPNDEFIKREKIPTALQSTLDHIVGELDMMNSQFQLFHERISITEGRIADLMEYVQASVKPHGVNDYNDEETPIDGGRFNDSEDEEDGDTV